MRIYPAELRIELERKDIPAFMSVIKLAEAMMVYYEDHGIDYMGNNAGFTDTGQLEKSGVICQRILREARV